MNIGTDTSLTAQRGIYMSDLVCIQTCTLYRETIYGVRGGHKNALLSNSKQVAGDRVIISRNSPVK